jgi:hypothetical protein
MGELKITGGACVGKVNASFPFATLQADKDKIVLNVSLVANLYFRPEDIITIRPCVESSEEGEGIEIIHHIANYDRNVIFRSTDNAEDVIRRIRETGFLDNVGMSNSENDYKIINQKKVRFPVKRTPAIIFTLLCLLLILTDVSGITKNFSGKMLLNIGILTVLGLLFFNSFLLLYSENFRKVILKKGVKLNNIRKTIIYLMIFSGITIIFLSVTRF